MVLFDEHASSNLDKAASGAEGEPFDYTLWDPAAEMRLWRVGRRVLGVQEEKTAASSE